MNFEDTLEYFSKVLKARFSFSFKDHKHLVTENGLTSGHVGNIVKSYSRFGITLDFDKDIPLDSGISFIFETIKNNYENLSYESAVSLLCSDDSYDYRNSSYSRELSKLIGKTQIYIVAKDESINKVLEMAHTFFEDAVIVPFENGLIVFVDFDDEFDEHFASIMNTVESDLMINITAIKGKTIDSLKNIFLYSMQLKEAYSTIIKFNLNRNMLDVKHILGLSILASLSPQAKLDFLDSIFSKDLLEFINLDIENTIDSLFKNDLNLTVTSKELFIHRNTLLYRIDKIKKISGFDLRSFSDSFLFNIAWILRKEGKSVT